ncbi:hypothetical protein ACLOAV_009784 [Pseudogymnoascus australis]
MALAPTGDRVVYLHDRDTVVPWEELQQAILLLLRGYSSLPPAHAWGRPPAPTHPPGLPAPTAENAKLWDLIPNELQSWPAQYREFEARYSGALQPPPSFAVTSAGGPIRRPTPRIQTASAPVVASADSTARASRGVFVELGSYFTAEGLRNSIIHLPPGAASMTGPETRIIGSTTASKPGAVVETRGSTSHSLKLSASAPVFVPRAFTSPTMLRPGAVFEAGPPFAGDAPAASLAPAVNLPPPAPAASGMGVPVVTGSERPLLRTAASSPIATPNTGAHGHGDVLPLVVAVTADTSAAAEMRKVVIRYVTAHTSVQDISMSVCSGLYGAVYSIRFRMEGRRRVAEIIFRDPVAIDTVKCATPGAIGYYTAMIDAEKQTWDERDEYLWPFPRGWVFNTTLESFPANDLIRAMKPQRHLRVTAPEGTELTTTEPSAVQPRTPTLSRRISLVGRGGLFNVFRERDIMNLLLRGKTISASRIVQVCIYNAGNATIVFAGVEAAVTAMKRFDEYNARSPVPKKVDATYSKCPSETLVQYTVDPLACSPLRTFRLGYLPLVKI